MSTNVESRLDDLLRRVVILEQAAATAAAGNSDVANWVANRCSFSDDAARTTSADLYDDYADWCRENRATPLPPTSATFARALLAYGLKRWRTSSGRGFVGIRINEW